MGADCSIMYCGPYLTWDVIFDSVILGQPVTMDSFAWDPMVWDETYWSDSTWDNDISWSPEIVLDWMQSGEAEFQPVVDPFGNP